MDRWLICTNFPSSNDLCVVGAFLFADFRIVQDLEEMDYLAKCKTSTLKPSNSTSLERGATFSCKRVDEYRWLLSSASEMVILESKRKEQNFYIKTHRSIFRLELTVSFGRLLFPRKEGETEVYYDVQRMVS